MLDLSLYLTSVNDEAIKKWEKRFEDAKMKVEICPGFSFFNHSGFLPFKIRFEEPSESQLNNKEWLSGFEIYVDDYNFEDVKKEVRPKKSFFKSLFSSTNDDVIVVSREIDGILSKCKKEITLSWGTQDTLELRMAVLSSAILLEIFEGVCYDPQEDLWHKREGAFNKFLGEVNGFESTVKQNQWKLHEFEKWS